MKRTLCLLFFVIVVLISNAQQPYDTLQERLRIYKIERLKPKNEVFYYAKNGQGKKYIVVDILNECYIKKGVYNCHCLIRHSNKKVILGTSYHIMINDVEYYIPEFLPINGELAFFVDCPIRTGCLFTKRLKSHTE